ncbi:hypothetical protein [Fictibacillus macauensis]|uniref:hypothetical protein n=1 Tax=Fictibacillus macauensis TaxID=245160 RepID=UPI00031A68B9|nr:hypothetical protein [Fictibacillus macauensis]
MLQLSSMLALDFAYLDTFTNRKDTAWGAIFCNEKQPNYYDSNHAHEQQVIDEVIQYFQSKHIIPRFYIYETQQQSALIAALLARGFHYEELSNPVQVWNSQIEQHIQHPDRSIEIVTEDHFQEALEVERNIWENGNETNVAQVFKKQFTNPAFTYYLLRENSIPCSLACIFQH